jgi:predicted ATPase
VVTTPNWAVPFVTRVRLASYKSIRACDVSLGPLTVLVGPNGSGKSNFVDALSFLADAVSSSPREAIERRGGIDRVLRQTPEPAGRLGIAVELQVPSGPALEVVTASYGFEIQTNHRPGQSPFLVHREECHLPWPGVGTFGFTVVDGQVVRTPSMGAPVVELEPDRLQLPFAAAHPALAPMFNRLRNMAFYNFDVAKLREPAVQSLDRLGPAGEHLGDVLAALDNHPAAKERVDDFLAAVLPDYEGLYRRFEGMYVTVELRTRTGPGGRAVSFSSQNMSDGTLRSAAVLAALYQPAVLEQQIPLVAIEEPELTLHPGAAGVLYDALTEASAWTQVVATSHSADLLDRDDLDVEIIKAVTSEAGQTVIAPVDQASRKTLRDRLFTAGELLRGGQLAPSHEGRELATAQAFDVFSS